MTTQNFLEFVTHSQQNSPAKRRHLEALWQAAYRAGQEAVAAHIEKWEPDGKRIAATIRAMQLDDQP